MSKKIITFTIFSIAFIMFGIVMTVYGILKVSTIYVERDFPSTYLDQNRNLIVYLPPGYDLEITKRYPVLYMLDGEEYFIENKELSKHQWSMKKTLDRLIKEGKLDKMIVVGIYSSDQKAKEYSSTNDHPDGQLENFAEFVKNEVKPFVDRKFRTLKDPSMTGIAGASEASYASFAIGTENPTIFQKIGLLAPLAETLEEKLEPSPKKADHQRVWLDDNSSTEISLDERLEDMLLYLYTQ